MGLMMALALEANPETCLDVSQSMNCCVVPPFWAVSCAHVVVLKPEN
jgi:hypothetical protein